MSDIVNDEYPNKQVISNEELKAQLAAEHTTTAKIDFPTEIITLPSRGQFYPEGHPLASGKIEMKYMTAKEEDILSSTNLIKQGVVIDKLLQSLIVTKVNYNDLLLCDKNAVFVAARVLAYGPDYEVEITCPNCGQVSKHVVDLQDFDEKVIDFDALPKHVNRFNYTFPVSKKSIEFKMLTHGDESNIAEDIKRYKKLSKISGVDPELSTRLKHIIVSVEGDESKGTINSFVDNLLSRDSLAFRNHLKAVTPELETTFTFECPHCDHVNEKMGMPINVNFFWVGA